MSTSKPRLRIERVEAVYGGFMRVPILGVLTLESGIHAALFETLADFQPAINNTGFAASWHNLSDAYFELRLFEGEGQVRLWANAVEIRLQNAASTIRDLTAEELPSKMSDLVTRVGSVLQSAEKRASFTAHSVTLNMHGRFHGEAVTELLSRFVGPPPAGLGAVAEIGAKYSFEAVGERTGSWLLIEPSSFLKPNGLYVSISAMFDGESLSIKDVVMSAVAYFAALARSPESPVEVVYAPAAA